MNQIDKFFIYRCEKGLKNRGLTDKREYIDRLKYEIDIITRMQFSGYFLIVADFVNWAKKNNILVGCGRGSAGGCLISYCLGITNIDPIKWDLLFERFMNPDRISNPDIDLDFPNKKRHLVIEYIRQKYGDDNVAHIGTYGTMRAKASVKDVCRVLGEPIILGEQICKLLLAPISGAPQSLRESIEKVDKIREMYNSNSREGTVLRWAEKIENLKKSQSTHACGLVISNQPLLNNIPLFISRNKEISTQWDMNSIEDTGFIKIDCLGVEALDKIETCLEIIKERYNKTIDIDNLPEDDEPTFSELRRGSTAGVFQMEGSQGIRDLLVRVKPTSIEDIIATTCLFRPGPISSGYTDIYVDVKNGTREPEYLVPELEKILGNTHSVFIYQETVMNIAKELCGYTGGMADELRKAIGKKKKKLMDKHEELFKKGWTKNGYPADAGNKLWDHIKNCSSYLFNRSHGCAYSIITYQTAYLKTHYPTEYMCAVMLCVGKKKKDQLIRYLTECRRLGIKVLPPDVNDSDDSFIVSNDKEIRFGLGPIKNVGAGSSVILEERKLGGKFTSLRNFCERTDLGIINRGKLESLIKAGAFDRFGHNRATLLGSVENIWKYREEVKKYDKKIETYKRKKEKEEERLKEIEEGLTKKKPLKPWPKPEEPQWPEVMEMEELTDSDIHSFEHELLGFFVSSHPLDKTKGMKDVETIDNMRDLGDNQYVTFTGVITDIREITTKTKKQKMAFVSIEDLTGSIEAIIFPSTYSKTYHLLEGKKPLLIKGDTDTIETDEGDKIVKIRVSNIELLDLSTYDVPEKIKVCIPILKHNDFIKLLDKHAGDMYEVEIATRLHDGTRVKFPIHPFIGSNREIFIKEVEKLSE